MVKNLFQHGDEVYEDMTVKKLCYLKMVSAGLGLLLGLLTPKEDRKATFFCAFFLLFVGGILHFAQGVRVSFSAEFYDDEDEDLEDIKDLEDLDDVVAD